jgi:hypothetical protein
MAGMLDHQVGWAVESTYNTPVTVTRFAEWLESSGLDWDPNTVQGKGLRVGSSVERAGRRVALVGKGSGKLEFELASKGFGSLLQGGWGTATSTLVSGSAYQQVFTPVVSGTYLPSFTLQEGIVKPGGSVDAYTFAGCTMSSFDLDQPENGIVQLSTNWDIRSLATATALATASFPTNPSIYSSALPITAAMAVGGTLTAPTTIALASVTGGTANVNVKSWKLSVDNGLDAKRDVLGGRNQPVVGVRKITVDTVVEYDATTGTILRDAYINQTPQPILLQSATPEALSAGTALMQLAIPVAYIEKGAIPQPTGGNVATTSLSWTVLDGLALAPAYMVLRTADTVL